MSEPSAATGLLADLVVRIDHVGICVRDLDAAGAAWTRLLGAPAVDREEVAAARAQVSWLRWPSEQTALELVAPLGENPGLSRFLDTRGEALHHIAIRVTDLAEALARLAAADVRLIDREPRPGAGGHMVAFLHPAAMGGTLVELVEHAP